MIRFNITNVHGIVTLHTPLQKLYFGKLSTSVVNHSAQARARARAHSFSFTFTCCRSCLALSERELGGKLTTHASRRYGRPQPVRHRADHEILKGLEEGVLARLQVARRRLAHAFGILAGGIRHEQGGAAARGGGRILLTAC